MKFRRRLAASPMGPVATFPLRVGLAAQRVGRVSGQALRWLGQSREYTNFTYDLSALNRVHLAWFVAEIAGIDVGEARGYVDEVLADDELKDHVARATAGSPHRWVSDSHARYGRRIGWYALVRATRPAHVVETGTDKGLSACLLAAAVRRNGHGRVTTIDINEDAGFLIGGPYAEVIDLRIGESLSVLGSLDSRDVGVFIHDSWHTREHELAEFDAVQPLLTPTALVLSDNCHVTDALPWWAESNDRQFLYFHEVPAGHWYPGGGIGVAWASDGTHPRLG